MVCDFFPTERLNFKQTRQQKKKKTTFNEMLHIEVPPVAEEHTYYHLDAVICNESSHTTVFLATWTGPEIAGYVLPNDKVVVKRTTSMQATNSEIDMLKRLAHRTNPSQDFFTKLIFVHDVISNQQVDLVMEYGGEDLSQALLMHNEQKQTLTERLKCVSKTLSHIMVCLVKLHALRLVHNDLKPENCVMDADGNVKLIDFAIAGHAYMINSEDDNLVGYDGEKVGSEYYMHPHLLWNRPLSLYQNDLWALGQTAFLLYTRQYIYDSEQASQSEKNNVLRLFLMDLDWYKKFPLNEVLQSHESFPLFVKFVSKMCCLSQAPERAYMLLLQDPFLCYHIS